jgi:hypothetical protein
LCVPTAAHFLCVPTAAHLFVCRQLRIYLCADSCAFIVCTDSCAFIVCTDSCTFIVCTDSWTFVVCADSCTFVVCANSCVFTISNYITNATIYFGPSAPSAGSCNIAFGKVIKCCFILSFIYLLPTSTPDTPKQHFAIPHAASNCQTIPTAAHISHFTTQRSTVLYNFVNFDTL